VILVQDFSAHPIPNPIPGEATVIVTATSTVTQFSTLTANACAASVKGTALWWWVTLTSVWVTLTYGLASLVVVVVPAMRVDVYTATLAVLV
jgi:hypothetical protein